jgi:hypothetical protein
MTEVRATSLEALVNRIYGGNFDQVLTISEPNAWLETFLEKWAADEERFFAISLEKEEIDMYSPILFHRIDLKKLEQVQSGTRPSLDWRRRSHTRRFHPQQLPTTQRHTVAVTATRLASGLI